MADAPQIGQQAPDFEATTDTGETVRLSDYRGQRVVLYFYPKDDTPGCTKQACSFRDAFEDFKEIEAKVIGISSDNEKSHKQFAEKHNLPFTLLADTDKKVRKSFGVPTNLLGLLPGRVTYVFDKKGICQGVFNSQMKVEKHVSESMKILEEL